MVTRTAIKSTGLRAPTDDLEQHTTILRQLKESVEVAQRQRGDPNDSFVRVSELAKLGLVRLVSGALQPPVGGFNFRDVPLVGAQTATFTATNKPGAALGAPTIWIPYFNPNDGQTYYIPGFA